MTDPAVEILVLALLLLLSGILAVAEIALASSRKSRLEILGAENTPRNARATALVDDPQRALSALRVVIIVMMAIVGYYAGEVLAAEIVSFLNGIPWAAPHAQAEAWVIVGVVMLACATLFCELLPRRVALINPERTTLVLSGTTLAITRIVGPFVGLFSKLLDGLFGLFGYKGGTKQAVTEAEVNSLIEEGLNAGVFNQTETEMVAGVLELDQLPVTAIMTPRPKIVFLNNDDPEEVNWRKIVASGHSYFPVFQGTRDQVLGMVAVKALWAHSAIGLSTNIKNLLLPPLIVPETMTSIQLLESFKKSSKHIALVTNEFGAIQGLVTLIDVLEAIVGDLPAQGRRNSPEVKQREDGSWLIDASLGIADLKNMLDLDKLPHEEDASFQTLGGFVVTQFGRIPTAADHFDFSGWRFEVVDMDRNRVDKILIQKSSSGSAPNKSVA